MSYHSSQFCTRPTEEEVSKIKKLLLAGKHPAPYLRNSGMSYEIGLEGVIMYDLHKKTVEEQACYADLVTQACGNDPQFELNFSCPSEKSFEIELKMGLDPTQIGNMAFMCLNGPIENRPLFRKLLLKFVEYSNDNRKYNGCTLI